MYARISLQNKFLLAVRNGERETVKVLLEQNELSYKKIVKPYDTGRFAFKDMKINVVGLDDSDINYRMWNDAIAETAKKGDHEMFMILLDCDMFTLTGILPFKDVLLKRPCILNDLLQTEKFSINARDINSNTVLHAVCFECLNNPPDSRYCSGDHRNQEIHETTEMLLRHNANINAKNTDGQTALTLASASGCTSIVYTILKWAKETNSFIDLNAGDIYNQTALMKAAWGKHPAVARLLIKAGAAVNLTDAHSMSALHYSTLEQWVPLDYIIKGESYGDFEEYSAARKTLEMNIRIEPPHRLYGRNREQLNKDRYETTKILLDCKDIDMNVMDYTGMSPLDLAVLDEESFVSDLLQEKGAKLSAYQEAKQQTNSNDLSVRGHNMLHRLAIYMEFEPYFSVLKPNDSDSSKLMSDIIEIFKKLNKDIKTNLISAKDFRGRTALHLAVMGGHSGKVDDHSVLATATLISFGCKVNETDNYGRTPLHYASKEEIADLLIKHGANQRKKDHNGIAAIEMYEKRVVKRESVCSFLDENSINELLYKSYKNVVTIRLCGPIQALHFHGKPPSKPIYKEKRLPENCDLLKLVANKISKEIKEFMEEIASAIKRQYPRFEFQIKPVGSAIEGTKISKPDEFDFMLILTKFSELCEVHQSPELPTGYVQLKRKQKRFGESKGSEFDAYFNEGTEVLDAAKLINDLDSVLSAVLRSFEFVTRQYLFEWGYAISIKIANAHRKNIFNIQTLSLRKSSPIGEGDGFLEYISVDMVPTIHLMTWCPDEVLPSLKNKIETLGCYLVMDYPQRSCSWIQYSAYCFKISFAPYESEIIRQSSDKAKHAFMIAKEMNAKLGEYLKNATSYVLKTCLLYCIEAFTPTVEMASELGLSFDDLKSQFDQLNVQFWLQNLMKCLLRFMLQDFCPCYFVPTFQVLNARRHSYLSIHWLLDGVLSLYQVVYNLYRCASQGDDNICYRSPSINFLFKYFDRIELITELSNAAFTELGINHISCNVPDDLHYESIYSRNDPRKSASKEFGNKSISSGDPNAQSCDCEYSVKEERRRAPRHAEISNSQRSKGRRKRAIHKVRPSQRGRGSLGKCDRL